MYNSKVKSELLFDLLSNFFNQPFYVLFTLSRTPTWQTRIESSSFEKISTITLLQEYLTAINSNLQSFSFYLRFFCICSRLFFSWRQVILIIYGWKLSIELAVVSWLTCNCCVFHSEPSPFYGGTFHVATQDAHGELYEAQVWFKVQASTTSLHYLRYGSSFFLSFRLSFFPPCLSSFLALSTGWVTRCNNQSKIDTFFPS